MKPRPLTALLLCALVVSSGCGARVPAAEASEPARAFTPNGETPHIVLDQFGYLPSARKVAFVREPLTGFDAGRGVAALETYQLVDTSSGRSVLTVRPTLAAEADPASGDRLWALDFSELTQPGRYIIRSETGAASAQFDIGAEVYQPVLRAAFRTFYFQRAGIAKPAPYADAASHLGHGQDGQARDFFRKSDPASARDLRGGWYDAGDYNQYTNWTADYIRTLMISWRENPKAWGDDFNIPESGNGVPDVIDEALWGLDWLERMQRSDGAVNAILGRDVASPPSAANGASYYGPPSTTATLSAAGTYAFAALILTEQDAKRHRDRIERLKTRAFQAWRWAEANPSVAFFNNDARDASLGLGAGQQEVDAATRTEKRFAAAAHLYALTREPRFAAARDQAVEASAFLEAPYPDAYHIDARDVFAFMTRPASLDPARTVRITGYVPDTGAVHWGSNSTMARLGIIRIEAGARDEAAAYLHYLHGANPLGLVYLSNMSRLGAERSVTNVYHSWFSDGAAPPGFLTGGPNPGYTWDACCPKTCGNADANRRCGFEPPTPPHGQPPLKAYADFNDDWPLNSWQISENSNGYQAAYLRLLAHFVD